ncbi:MAG: tetratricopeptide repeat protein, partial [Candidatus Muiribacteriaceae bacterium]
KEFERQKVDKVEYLDMPAKLSVIFYNKKYIVEKIFDILHDYYSDNWFYYYLRGYLNAYFLDTDGAAVYYEKALHNAQAYNRDEIAEVYEEYRDRKKVVLDPNSYEALFMKASNFYRNGLYKKSMELARKALLKAEDKAPVYKVMGLCYYGLGEFEESKRHLAKASEKMPDDKDILFTFGEIYFLERNYYEALDYYKNVLKIDPEHIESLFRIGKIYSEQSEHEDALTYMRQVLDHEPNHVEALVVMGNIYTKTNRFEEAISAFQRALEIDPGLIDAYVSLSIVYYKKWEIENNSRMLDSAIEVLQQASELDPENDMVNQYLQYYIQQKAGG